MAKKRKPKPDLAERIIEELKTKAQIGPNFHKRARWPNVYEKLVALVDIRRIVRRHAGGKP